MLKILVITLAILGSNQFAMALAPEFQTIAKNDPFIRSANQENIIFETSNHYILKSALTNFDSFDYYFIQIGRDKSFIPWLEQNGHVVLLEKEEFAILEIRNENQLLKISNAAHEQEHFCGMIQKLSPLPLSFSERQANQLIKGSNPQVKNALILIDENNILETIKAMTEWGSRHHSHIKGSQFPQQLKTLYETHLPIDRNDVSVDLVKHKGSQQNSVVVRIEGQVFPEEKVILGSHLDSINPSNNQFAPGADDNASGTATNLEVFRVLMKNNVKPQRTIEIHAYGAEEIGLVGSGEIADSYKNQNQEVIAMVQFDMNGFSKKRQMIHFVKNGTNSNLTQQLHGLVEDYLSVPSTNAYLFYGSSDHASWHKRGFPVAFPTENPFSFNPKIHTSNDTMDYINSPDQIKEFGKLGVAYLMHFAGFDSTATH